MTLIKSKDVKIKDKDKSENTYLCNWCSGEFTMVVGETSSPAKHSNVSSQVICPFCSNFIKTWR